MLGGALCLVAERRFVLVGGLDLVGVPVWWRFGYRQNRRERVGLERKPRRGRTVMSCWMVEDEHINVLLCEGLRPSTPGGPLRWSAPDTNEIYGYRPESLTRETADRVGQMLLDQNRASVNSRYDEDKAPAVYVYARPRFVDWQLAEVFKAIGCYEYQACETPDWEQSEAFRFCRALEQRTISRLPGFSDADTWGITRETVPLAEKKRARLSSVR